jgi:hypothetical protein
MIAIALIIIVGLLILNVYQRSMEKLDFGFQNGKIENPAKEKGWIIIEGEPSKERIEGIRKLEGWTILIVGTKTYEPTWTTIIPNTVYLTTEMQDRLNYSITKYLPKGHYARKNIGYLYAIQQGKKEKSVCLIFLFLNFIYYLLLLSSLFKIDQIFLY